MVKEDINYDIKTKIEEEIPEKKTKKKGKGKQTVSFIMISNKINKILKKICSVYYYHDESSLRYICYTLYTQVAQLKAEKEKEQLELALKHKECLKNIELLKVAELDHEEERFEDITSFHCKEKLP